MHPRISDLHLNVREIPDLSSGCEIDNREEHMTGFATLFSRRCCGGPVLMLSLAFLLFGTVFTLLSAQALGLVFMATGAATLGLCMLLGKSRCTRPPGPLGRAPMR